MALMYRGNEVQAENIVVDTVEASEHGTYRGASVSFRRAANASHRATPTKQYRGVTY